MSSARQDEIESSRSRAPAAPAPHTSARVQRAAVVAATLLAALAWWASQPAGGPAQEPELPALPEREAACDVPELQRGQRGRAARAEATEKIARYPFAPEDGLAALQLLLEAERCFELASDAAAQAVAAAHGRAWRARMQGDARDHWLRYRVALASGRPRHALPDIEFLLALFASEAGPFTARLRRAQLELPERSPAEETP